MERQQVLSRDGAPLELWAIIDEAALRRRVGSPEVMKEQLCRLKDAAELSHITLQVIPFDNGAHPGMMGAFMIMDFPDPLDQSLVVIENGAGNLLLEDLEEIRRYEVMYDHLQAIALSPTQTSRLLRTIAAET